MHKTLTWTHYLKYVPRLPTAKIFSVYVNLESETRHRFDRPKVLSSNVESRLFFQKRGYSRSSIAWNPVKQRQLTSNFGASVEDGR